MDVDCVFCYKLCIMFKCDTLLSLCMQVLLDVSVKKNIFFIYFSLNIGLRDVRAVDFDVDLSVVLFLLYFFFKRPFVEDQVEGQQKAQHTESKESDIDLEDNTTISNARRVHLCMCVFKCVCVNSYPEWVSP